jgi:glycerol-3-phosphate dehydrogenase
VIWGGIKYFLTFEFGLVAKLCLARNRLMRKFPNQILQIGIFASIGPTTHFGRPLGTLLSLMYWGTGSFRTKPPASYSASTAKHLEPHLISGRPAIKHYEGFLPDNDSRFVFDFARHAIKHGADLRTYTSLDSANHNGEDWELRLSGSGMGNVSAKSVINAAGAFYKEVSVILGVTTKTTIAISKGIHLVLGLRLTENYQALAFFNDRKKLFYVFPMGDRSMVGTTDIRVEDPKTAVTKEDRDAFIKQLNAQMELETPITAKDVVSERSGIRSLVVQEGGFAEIQDNYELSREYVVEVNKDLSVVTILGGKLTDCIDVGQETVRELSKLGHQVAKLKNWCGEGSQLRKGEFYQLIAARTDSIVAERIADGIWRRHGEAGFEIVGTGTLVELIPGLGITEQEIRHIADSEMVSTREDLLRRRLPVQTSRSAKELAANKPLEKLLVELGL